VEDKQNRDDINRAEWGNPDNWSTIYFSKKDSRTWVPKKNPRHGSTINFGSSSGARWIYYLFGFFLMLGVFFGALIAFVIIGGN